jgi:hypothetical protein
VEGGNNENKKGYGQETVEKTGDLGYNIVESKG